MEAVVQEGREPGVEERVANIVTIKDTGTPESSVQVVSSQTNGEKRKALLVISGNSTDKGIKKTKAVERKKPTEFKVNKSAFGTYVSRETRHRNEAAKAMISMEVVNYVRGVEEQIYKTCNEQLQGAMAAMAAMQSATGIMEEDHEETKSRVIILETQNKELRDTVNGQAEELEALQGGIKIPASRAEPNTIPRHMVIPATPIRPMTAPMQGNKAGIANTAMNTPKAPTSYAQVAATHSSELDKSQRTMVQKKGRTAERKEIKKIEVSSRFIFTRQGGADKMPEEDLMLELNMEIRRLEGVSHLVKAIKVSDSGRGAISALLSDGSDANNLINRYRDRLIRAVKAVDVLLTVAEVVTKWHKVKLAGMPLARYLPNGVMEFLQREIECQVKNPLMLAPRWILHPDRLYEELQSKNRKGAEVVLTVGSV